MGVIYDDQGAQSVKMRFLQLYSRVEIFQVSYQEKLEIKN